MVQTSALAGQATDAQSLNQATRWINTKEAHADKIISTVSEYMLAQRVKPAVFKSHHEYQDALVTHHAVMLAAVRKITAATGRAVHRTDPGRCHANQNCR